MQCSVTTHFLEMTQQSELVAKRIARPDLTVTQVSPAWPELNRFYYTAVGGDWYWVDRLPWSYAEWLRYLARPELETWVMAVNGLPAGYVELEWQAGDHGQIMYFGLLSPFLGQGLGGHLLTVAVERLWSWGANRVWVHTCSLDHPAALSNYQARGFRIYDTRVSTVDLPDETPGPWPGARAGQVLAE